MKPSKAETAPLYVARAFFQGGEPLAVGRQFAYDPKADRDLVATLLSAGKLTKEAPAPVEQPAKASEAKPGKKD
jgi:hypothetical protein